MSPPEVVSIEALLGRGWPTILACLAGALYLVVRLKRALQRAELALRTKLFVATVALGLATTGAGIGFGSEEMTRRALEVVQSHPWWLVGTAAACLVASSVFVIAFWIRAWLRWTVRLVFIAALGVLVLGWGVARFFLCGALDRATGLALGETGWRALFDGLAVGFVVFGVARSLEPLPRTDAP